VEASKLAKKLSTSSLTYFKVPLSLASGKIGFLACWVLGLGILSSEDSI